MIQIRHYNYRNQPGFSITGRSHDGVSLGLFGIKIFTESREKAERIVAAIKANPKDHFEAVNRILMEACDEHARRDDCNSEAECVDGAGEASERQTADDNGLRYVQRLLG